MTRAAESRGYRDAELPPYLLPSDPLSLTSVKLPVRLRLLLPAVPGVLLGAGVTAPAQNPAARSDSAPMLLVPARVFDGMENHDGWAVLVRGERIVAAGPAAGIAIP